MRPDTRTMGEKLLGKRQRYVNAGVNPAIYRPGSGRWGMNPTPEGFRKPRGLKPVKGGRWSVRKIAARTQDGYQWHAYTKGTMKGASSRFATQADAIRHAQRMARLAAMLKK